MTPDSPLRLWLVRWLYLVGVGHFAGGILMTWCAHTFLLTDYHQQVLDNFGLGSWAVDLQLWWVQLFGATLQAFSLFMLLLVYVGNRQRNAFPWSAMALILLVWAPQDAWISLQKNMLLHVWVDLMALVVLVPPLIMLAFIDRSAINQEQTFLADTDLPDIKPDDQIILFDAVCKLCNYWSRLILRVDKQERFKLCSVQSPQGQALLAHYGFPLDQFETMVLVRNKLCLTHSDAFIGIMQGLPFPWRILALFRWLPKRLRDACYSVIARNRYRVFGRYDQCMVPPEGYERRFLGG